MSVTPCREQLGRQAHVADLGHARIAAWATVLQHQHRLGVDLQRGIGDAFLVVLQVLEHDRAAAVAQQVRLAAEGLSTAPRGARLPRSTQMPPSATSGLSSGRITSSL